MNALPIHPELQRALENVGHARDSLAQIERQVAEHAAAKCATRTAAITRIMSQPAPSGKPHSWSSAEAVRDSDPAYADHKAKEALLAHWRGQADTSLLCARLQAEYLARTLPPVAIELPL